MFRDPIELPREWARKYGRVYGAYANTKPVLVIGDAQLIKQVMIKDFSLFVNRFDPNGLHEVWSQNIFFSKDEKWKRLRSITTPTFTTGKLRRMHGMMQMCVNKLTNYLDTVTQGGPNEIDTKNVVSGFTIDVVASTTFATDTNTNGAERKSAFVEKASNLFNFNLIKAMTISILPKWVLRALGWTHAFPGDSFEFMLDLTRNIVRTRKANPEAAKRNDLVQLLLNASVDEKEMTNLDYGKLTASMDETSAGKLFLDALFKPTFDWFTFIRR